MVQAISTAIPRETVEYPSTNSNFAASNRLAINDSRDNLQNLSDPRNYLNQVSENEAINDSLTSSEGIEEIKTEPKEQSASYKLIRDTIPEIGLSAASIAHCISGLNRIGNFLPKSLGKLLDDHSQKISKGINIFNYLVTAADAFWNKRSVDGLARAAYPAVIPFVELKDMFMASGFSSGTTMIEKALQSKTDNMPNNSKVGGNLFNNLKAFGTMWKELTQDGPSGFFKKIGAVIKNPDPLMFVGGNCNFLGAFLGVVFGKSSDFIRKIATLVRGAGSIGTDIAKIFCGDSNFKFAGYAYIVVAALDIIKDYVQAPLQRTLSHFSVAINNFANYYYLRASKARSDLAAA